MQTTDRAGNVVSATYNALGQVTSVTADGVTTTYSADPDGDFVATSNAASTDTIYFDTAGPATSEVTVRGTHRYVSTSTYNDVGLRTQLAVSGMWNAAIGYHYNAITHQLDTLTDVAGAKTTLGYNGDQLGTRRRTRSVRSRPEISNPGSIWKS